MREYMSRLSRLSIDLSVRDLVLSVITAVTEEEKYCRGQI
jgi:hypothetical protein